MSRIVIDLCNSSSCSDADDSDADAMCVDEVSYASYSDESDDDASSYSDDESDDRPWYTDRRQSVRQHVGLTADSVFVRSMTTFCDEYFSARDRFLATPVEKRGPESSFCRLFVDSLCLLVGSNSAWVHDTATRESWHADVSKATTIDALTAVIQRIILALRHPHFTKTRASMTTFFDGLDSAEARFG